jgi:hypothetical protein
VQVGVGDGRSWSVLARRRGARRRRVIWPNHGGITQSSELGASREVKDVGGARNC